ncbi:hypothetical protein TBC1_12570 [Lentimicrobium saccharophilum]|uniref:Uncharacterized protein n=1 Tax=Lentimicrobium saccharophilum TaxID=1678841 RepID=A0A0S7C1R1_9BACT|nr:hypothetical protein [Lentimicrobium saccharophilum]GAP44759.1 hypothetical protein TBC1_12570 [Lentimicrobium saccharophilum]
MKATVNLSQGFLILLSSFLFISTSCTKDADDDTDENQNNQRLPRICRLKSLETENGLIQDSSNAVFIYNKSNFLVTICGSEEGDSITIQYDADGRVNHTTYFDSQGITYELNYKRIADKVIVTSSNVTDRQLVYTVDADGNVSRLEIKQLINQQWIVLSYVDFVWQQGNLSVLTYYNKVAGKHGCPEKSSGIWSVFANSILYCFGENEIDDFNREGFYKSMERIFTYDNKKNPFKDFQIFRYSEAGFYAGENNVVTLIERYYDSSGDLIDSYGDESFFTYNSDDFPVEMNQADTGWSYKESYFYE